MRPFLKNKIAAEVQPLSTTIGVLQAVVAPGEPGMPPTIDERLLALRTGITGQDTLIGPGMQNRTSALRLNAIEPQLTALTATVTALSNVVTARFADLGPRLSVAEAAVIAVQARVTAEEQATVAQQAKNTANDLADAARVAHDVSQDAQLALLTSRATDNETKIIAAQAKADAAKADAAAAINAAATAAANATAAQTAAAAAQAAAATAQTAAATQAARARTKLVPTPGMALGATATLNVVWDTPFPDAVYAVIPALVGGSLLGLGATVTAQTAAGCTVQIKNTLGLVLLAGAGTLDLFAYRAA